MESVDKCFFIMVMMLSFNVHLCHCQATARGWNGNCRKEIKEITRQKSMELMAEFDQLQKMINILLIKGW